MHFLPANYSFFNNSGLLFGFYFQPFSPILESEINNLDLDQSLSQGSNIISSIPLIEGKLKHLKKNI